MAETVVIRKKGKKPIKFKKGGLHRSLNVPEGQKIPASKLRAALAGKYGPKAKKQAMLYVNVLKKGQRTARRHRLRGAEEGAVVVSAFQDLADAYDEILGR